MVWHAAMWVHESALDRQTVASQTSETQPERRRISSNEDPDNHSDETTPLPKGLTRGETT